MLSQLIIQRDGTFSLQEIVLNLQNYCHYFSQVPNPPIHILYHSPSTESRGACKQSIIFCHIYITSQCISQLRRLGSEYRDSHDTAPESRKGLAQAPNNGCLAVLGLEPQRSNQQPRAFCLSHHCPCSLSEGTQSGGTSHPTAHFTRLDRTGDETQGKHLEAYLEDANSMHRGKSQEYPSTVTPPPPLQRCETNELTTKSLWP